MLYFTICPFFFLFWLTFQTKKNKLSHPCLSYTYLHILQHNSYAFILQTHQLVFLSFPRFDHLSQVLAKVLSERPENVVDVFEDVSKETKRAKFTSQVDTVQDKLDQTTEVALATIQKKLFSVRSDNIWCPYTNNTLVTVFIVFRSILWIVHFLKLRF